VEGKKPTADEVLAYLTTHVNPVLKSYLVSPIHAGMTWADAAYVLGCAVLHQDAVLDAFIGDKLKENDPEEPPKPSDPPPSKA